MKEHKSSSSISKICRALNKSIPRKEQGKAKPDTVQPPKIISFKPNPIDCYSSALNNISLIKDKFEESYLYQNQNSKHNINYDAYAERFNQQQEQEDNNPLDDSFGTKSKSNYSNPGNKLLDGNEEFDYSNSNSSKSNPNHGNSGGRTANTQIDDSSLEKRLKLLLNILDLNDLTKTFKENKISFNDVLYLSKEDLVELNINLCSRNRILRFIEQYKPFGEKYTMEELKYFFKANRSLIINQDYIDNSSLLNVSAQSTNTQVKKSPVRRKDDESNEERQSRHSKGEQERENAKQKHFIFSTFQNMDEEDEMKEVEVNKTTIVGRNKRVELNSLDNDFDSERNSTNNILTSQRKKNQLSSESNSGAKTNTPNFSERERFEFTGNSKNSQFNENVKLKLLQQNDRSQGTNEKNSKDSTSNIQSTKKTYQMVMGKNEVFDLNTLSSRDETFKAAKVKTSSVSKKQIEGLDSVSEHNHTNLTVSRKNTNHTTQENYRNRSKLEEIQLNQSKQEIATIAVEKDKSSFMQSLPSKVYNSSSSSNLKPNQRQNETHLKSLKDFKDFTADTEPKMSVPNSTKYTVFRNKRVLKNFSKDFQAVNDEVEKFMKRVKDIKGKSKERYQRIKQYIIDRSKSRSKSKSKSKPKDNNNMNMNFNNPKPSNSFNSIADKLKQTIKKLDRNPYDFSRESYNLHCQTEDNYREDSIEMEKNLDDELNRTTNMAKTFKTSISNSKSSKNNSKVTQIQNQSKEKSKPKLKKVNSIQSLTSVGSGHDRDLTTKTLTNNNFSTHSNKNANRSRSNSPLDLETSTSKAKLNISTSSNKQITVADVSSFIETIPNKDVDKLNEILEKKKRLCENLNRCNTSILEKKKMLKLINDKSVQENEEDLQNILDTSELNQTRISNISRGGGESKDVYVKRKIPK